MYTHINMLDPSDIWKAAKDEKQKKEESKDQDRATISRYNLFQSTLEDSDKRNDVDEDLLIANILKNKSDFDKKVRLGVDILLGKDEPNNVSVGEITPYATTKSDTTHKLTLCELIEKYVSDNNMEEFEVLSEVNEYLRKNDVPYTLRKKDK